MKLSLQIPDEINDIITALTESFSITSIVESSGVSTITTETLTIFDNLSETMLLKSGMVVTIGDVNYQVSNIVNSLVNTFDVTATNLTDTEWNVAASFKFGSKNEIDKALNQENNNDSKLKRFPLIWLFTPIERDFNNQVIDFESDLVFSFAFQSNKTDRFQKRLDGNIKTILEPLLKLFLLHVQSSDFNYMFEFEGYKKALDVQTNNFYFYGTSDQSKSVLNTTTDAIEVQTSLKFKKQFEYTLGVIPTPPEPPEPPTYPAVIEDGNSVAWYLSDEPTTITKDASDFVSVWADKLGSGHDLLQATGTNQPKWFDVDGILFDGIDNFMKTLAFTYEQPEQIYIVFKQVTWLSNARVIDGYNNDQGIILNVGSSPAIVAYAGSASASSNNLSVNTFGIVRILFNGINSSFQINEFTASLGDFGIRDMDGFTLGSIADGTNNANIQVKEILLRNIADSAQDEQDIYDYLALKYSI